MKLKHITEINVTSYSRLKYLFYITVTVYSNVSITNNWYKRNIGYRIIYNFFILCVYNIKYKI